MNTHNIAKKMIVPGVYGARVIHNPMFPKEKVQEARIKALKRG